MNVCMCVSDNRKAVELNSMSLSEWCMDNSLEVWGGVQGLIALTVLTSGLIGGGYRHWRVLKVTLTETLELSYFLNKDQLKLILTITIILALLRLQNRNREVLCNWIPQHRHSESHQRTNHEGGKHEWSEWDGEVCVGVSFCDNCVWPDRIWIANCPAVLTTLCDTVARACFSEGK